MNTPKPAKPYGERVVDELMNGLAELAEESDRILAQGGSDPTSATPALYSRAQRRAAGVAAARAARRRR